MNNNKCEMNLSELGSLLKEYYENCNNAVTGIHLFGIKYAKIIKSKKFRLKDIINYSGLKESYSTELNKGINLSKYVTINNDINLNKKFYICCESQEKN